MYKIKAADILAKCLKISSSAAKAKEMAKLFCDIIIEDYKDDAFVSSLNKLKIHEWQQIRKNI
jgi:hypothetical protein